MSIKSNRRKDTIWQRLKELVDLAQQLSPDFLVVKEKPPYEDEVARLEFFVPERLGNKVRQALIKRSWEILLEDGFEIGIGVRNVKKSEISAMMAAKQGE
ncbi:MAG: hypothetical protein NZ805_10180 [Armatimonadetes bacterium]|nr:hypothetical protein [Armatimonadota bacterium]